MAAQRGSVTCSKLYLLWRTQDLDTGTKIHVIKYLRCCLHNHRDTHTVSNLDSLLLFLMPYSLFYTHSSQSGLSKHAPTFTSFLEGFHITLGMKSKLLWKLPLSLSPFPLQSHCPSLCSRTHQIAAIPSTCKVLPTHTDLVKRWGQRLNGEQGWELNHEKKSIFKEWEERRAHEKTGKRPREEEEELREETQNAKRRYLKGDYGIIFFKKWSLSLIPGSKLLKPLEIIVSCVLMRWLSGEL